jgi:hypothetical protein
MVELDLKLLGQLSINGFDDLTNTIVESAQFGR